MRYKLGDLRYLKMKPKTVYWQVIAEAPEKKLTFWESFDTVYDSYDLKIRGLL